MGASKILLVLGSGKNIGLSVAKSFSSAGYKVVLVSRSADGQTTPEGYTTIQADLAKPDSVPSIFASVKEKLGSSPNVVVYNAAAVSPAADATNPLTVPVKDLEKDLAVANSSPYAAAREAVAGFEGLDKSLPKAFVYTGNRLAAVTAPAANFVTLGVGKSAASYWIGVSSALFKDKGYK
jgi:NAD(P)-dependent dehydrogenase (short-subunit alcohol dehydrogenase family)